MWRLRLTDIQGSKLCQKRGWAKGDEGTWKPPVAVTGQGTRRVEGAAACGTLRGARHSRRWKAGGGPTSAGGRRREPRAASGSSPGASAIWVRREGRGAGPRTPRAPGLQAALRSSLVRPRAPASPAPATEKRSPRSQVRTQPGRGRHNRTGPSARGRGEEGGGTSGGGFTSGSWAGACWPGGGGCLGGAQVAEGWQLGQATTGVGTPPLYLPCCVRVLPR